MFPAIAQAFIDWHKFRAFDGGPSLERPAFCASLNRFAWHIGNFALAGNLGSTGFGRASSLAVYSSFSPSLDEKPL